MRLNQKNLVDAFCILALTPKIFPHIFDKIRVYEKNTCEISLLRGKN